jgi:hypothetical protein
MPVLFDNPTVTIPSGTGRRSIQSSVGFNGRSVLRAGVALNGFRFDFDSADHHIDNVEADTDLVSVSGDTVTFRVNCNYRDKNGDDRYSGSVNVLVIAETV